jgi:hypothetical protein
MGFGGSLATLNEMLYVVAMWSPPTARAADVTVATTVVPTVKERRGVSTRTVLPSDQDLVPAIATPSAVTEKAAALDFVSMAALNRTEIGWLVS